MVDLSADLVGVLSNCLPNDHCAQTGAEYYVHLFHDRLWKGDGTPRVLDLGCGDGRSLDVFRRRGREVDWVGIDLADSPAARQRAGAGATFIVGDGGKIPFPAGSFDMIYSKHVLEHVRHPLAFLLEARRVLKATGYYAGSVSQLEPYHGRSFWNFTPLGFKEIVEEAGLRVCELRPGVDAVSLMAWHLRDRLFREAWWSSESPLNRLFNAYGRLRRKEIWRINLLKLRFCGTFGFLVRPLEGTR
ncbi:MAG: class I SAM-dependent methyltransferase [Candidatus Rokuibacteriota bacterium]